MSTKKACIGEHGSQQLKGDLFRLRLALGQKDESALHQEVVVADDEIRHYELKCAGLLLELKRPAASHRHIALMRRYREANLKYESWTKARHEAASLLRCSCALQDSEHCKVKRCSAYWAARDTLNVC